MALLNNNHISLWNSTITDDMEYDDTILQAERAIEGGILPVRIAAGSSGSYFVRNLEGKNIGVFKPKDEEPYGRFNPKWSKWLQKTLCPCCFGRSCLVHNQGYLSEAGASLIDTKLRLNIVPKTRVIHLTADSFNYPAYQRHLIIAKREINESVGRHMHGRRVFEPTGLQAKTDNSNEGDPNTDGTVKTAIDDTTTTNDIHIAAIDNGLAFPFKHPDEWRAYPFHWAWLKQAKVPFSDEIITHILPFISDMNFVQHELCDEIQRLFSQDKNYDRRLVERQLSVMRGQILNLAQAMRDGKSPFELVQMPGVLVERLHIDPSFGHRQFKKKFNDRYPLFSWF
ncbi:unnamed protein product [Rotaria sp. Silwood1]|nr:unnamed protein product [Rotaria sp. Silwood1]